MKRLSKYCFAAGLMATLLSGLLLLMGRHTVGFFIGVNENFYLKYYYDFINSTPVRNTTFPNSLTIVDVSKYHNRKDVARIIDLVYENNPLVIGVDIFFRDNPDIREDVNDELLDVIYKTKDKTVFVLNLTTTDKGGAYINYPFWEDGNNSYGITYASPAGLGFYDKYSRFDNTRYINLDNTQVPRFSYEVVRKSGKAVRNYKSDFYVNYSRKDLIAKTIDDTIQIIPYTIENKIVIIGDLSDQQDMSVLPFRFGDKIRNEISGIENNAYSILSLIEDNRSNITKRKYYGFQEFNILFSILLSILMASFFSMITVKISDIKKQYEKSKSKSIIITLLQPLLLIIIEFLVVLMFYAITFFSNKIPDLFLSMISIALVGISVELTNIIYGKI